MKTVLVTPSWSKDFERCKMLIESAKIYARGFDKHLILVDEHDVDQFRSLVHGNVELVVKQDLLPSWLHQSKINPRWWWSLKALPARGWIVQQISKLAIAEQYDAESFCYVDSDTMFIRSFTPEQLWRGDKVRLYRDERKPHFYKSRRYKNWYRSATVQFGLGQQEEQDGAYIAQMNVIHKQHLLAMLRDIESRSQCTWQEMLIKNKDFSEYILYGVYAENCTNLKHHYVTSDPLCHSSWFYDLNTEKGIETFLQTTEPHHVAVHIQSNLHIDTALIQRAMNRTTI